MRFLPSFDQFFLWRKRKLTEKAQDHSCLYLSQMKSGTTFICNFISAYNQLNAGCKSVDLSAAHKFGVLRSDKPTTAKDFSRIYNVYLDNISGNDINLVQAHYLLKAKQPRDRLLCTTRSMYDYVNSSYDFHFLKRNKIVNSKDDALRQILGNFIEGHKQQKVALNYAERHCIVKYEKLMTETEPTFLKILNFFSDGKVNTKIIDECLHAVSKTRVREVEVKTGSAFNMEKSVDFK